MGMSPPWIEVFFLSKVPPRPGTRKPHPSIVANISRNTCAFVNFYSAFPVLRACAIITCAHGAAADWAVMYTTVWHAVCNKNRNALNVTLYLERHVETL